MPLFRNRNKLSKQEENKNRQTALTDALAKTVLEPLVLEPEAEERKTYAQEVNERVVKVRRAQDDLVLKALQHGESEEALPAVIADAMNSGVQPKILQGMTFKGSGVSLTLLDGHVPAEALEVYLNKSYDTGEVSSAVVGLTSAAKTLKGDSFNYEDTGNLPQHSQPGDLVDTEMLAKIDAHIPPQVLAQPETH